MSVTEMNFLRHTKHKTSETVSDFFATIIILRMEKPSAVAVLISGGLDSDVLLAEMSMRYKRVIPIYVQQSLRWEKVERYWLARFLKAIRPPSLRPLRVISLAMK